MKKVIAFILVLALALGYIVFTHASVTANQEDVRFYPTQESGDPSVLNGLTLSTVLTDYEHLVWYPQHTFGGDTVTEFVYSRKPVWTASSNKGSFEASLSFGDEGSYDHIIYPIAAQTPPRTSTTKTLRLSDYVSHYAVRYPIWYEDETRECSATYADETLHTLFHDIFRFPVQEGDTATIRVSRDAYGKTAESFSPDFGASLLSYSDMNADGIWFLMDFRDQNGVLPYESPQGHGIYYIPWKSMEPQPEHGVREWIIPDASRLRLCVPLEAGPKLVDLMADPERKLIHLLTLEGGQYILTTFDHETGASLARLSLAQDGEQRTFSTIFRYLGDHLLIKIGDQIILTDAAGENILLKAPIVDENPRGISAFDPAEDDLYFDGDTLFIAYQLLHQDNMFIIDAWTEGRHAYHGMYGCSLGQNNGADFFIGSEAVKLADNERDLTRYICPTREEE